MEKSASWRAVHDNDSDTDKHRMIWIIHIDVFSSIDHQGNAHSAAQRDIRTIKPNMTPDKLQEVYQRGTLHVVTSAPRRDYSTRISLEPEVQAGGEYFGVLLNWVGNRVYQHNAMVRSATAENSLGLGILRSAFSIVKPWRGPDVDRVNVMKGKVHPSNEFMREVLAQRRIQLSHDQKNAWRQQTIRTILTCVYRLLQGVENLVSYLCLCRE